MQVKVMRGIPGSGKSTYAKLLREAAVLKDLPFICSADDFFTLETGTYKFDPLKLGEAHKWCMQMFLIMLRDKMTPVIVDNTNINLEDIAPYIAVGEAMGYDVEVIQVDTDPEVAAARNVHSVPRNKVMEMHRRLNSVRLPNRWKVTRITLEKQNG